MALKQLSEEQVRTWTRSQKDEWWFKNVFRGDMPQLTIRSGITGFLLGGVLAATALYIAAKTGIGIGVGELVAGELLGESSKLLEPFRYSRYAQGKLHPVSNSPFPWS